jgi:hypothetical protein
MAKRLSDVVRKVSEGFDSRSGICFKARESCEGDDFFEWLVQLPYIGITGLGELCMESLALGTEMFVARPLYCIENVILGKRNEPSKWTFEVY